MSKRNREPTELEKTYMVRHIWLCEKEGMTKDQLTQERKWLKEKFECKMEVASAVTAWMRIRVDRIVPGQIALSDAQFARRWVGLAGSVQEREQFQTEVAEYLQVDKSIIEAISDGVREEAEALFSEEDDGSDERRDKVVPAALLDAPAPLSIHADFPDYQVRFIQAYVRLMQAQNKPLSPVFEELAQNFKVRPAAIRAIVEGTVTVASAAVSPPKQSKNEARSMLHFDRIEHLKSGEHVDYGTKSKEAWRQTWKRFLEKNTDPRMRPYMRVLCLPGKRCLEIQLYLDLGFRIENIVAVEGGDRIARADCEWTVRRNAEKWGGTPDLRLAKLEEILPHEKEPFHVVSLDFIGQMCTGYLHLASQVPVHDDACFLITQSTQRWKKDVQQWRQEGLERIIHSEKEDAVLIGHYRKMFGGKAARVPSATPEDFPMGTMNLGADRQEHWQFRQRLRRMPMLPEAREIVTTHQREREEYNISVVLAPLLEKLLGVLQEKALFDPADLSEVSSLCNVGKLVTTVMFDKPLIDQLERWSYQSTVSDYLHEFHTDMAVVSRPRGSYEQWKPVVDFLSHAVEHALDLLQGRSAPEDVLQRIRFEVRRGKDKRSIDGKAERSDDIVCLLDGRVIGHKKVGELLAAAKEFTDYLTSKRHAHPSIFSRIPRREIHY